MELKTGITIEHLKIIASFNLKTIYFILQGDGTTWEIHLGTRLCVKVVPP